MTFTVIRGDDRDVTTTDWLTSRHSFSFGDHYTPSNTHFGSLLVVNDDVVSPGQGFDTHPHRESEIVTWVMSGSLVHQDSEGHSGVVYTGLAQRMSAGTGILHSERNDTWPARQDSGSLPVRFVQMWVMPDEHGLDPSYAQRDISDELRTGVLVPVASGDPGHDSAIRIANSSATMFAARLGPGQRVVVPPARFTHVYVTSGTVRVLGETLVEGDALRGLDIGGEVIVGGEAIPGRPASGGSEFGSGECSEVLIWSMDRALGEF